MLNFQVMNNTEEKELLLGILPAGYSYKVIQYEIHGNSVDDFKFELETRVDVSEKENVKSFLSDFNESSRCTFNIQDGKADRSTDNENARRVLQGFRKCCLNVFSKDNENRKPLQSG